MSLPNGGNYNKTGKFVSNNTLTALVLSAAPAVLRRLSLGNTGAAPYYVKVHNAVADPGALGTSLQCFMCPGSTSGTGREVVDLNIGCTTGIVLKITTSPDDTDETAVNTNLATVNAEYRP